MEDPSLKGIIPRMVTTIFDMVESADENIEFTVSVSYIEIYMEKIRDLLDSTKQNLQVRENKEKGIYIDGATEVNVTSEEEVMEVMRMGQSNRAVGFTLMNAESSRSHSLFVVKVYQKHTQTNSVKNGKLYMVDLAGSEKVITYPIFQLNYFARIAFNSFQSLFMYGVCRLEKLVLKEPH
jgi:kinesin family member 5